MNQLERPFSGLSWRSRRAAVCAGVVVLVAAACHGRPGSERAGEGFVGSARCGECHRAAYEGWRESQHAAAMQPATDSTVLGDFRDAQFTEDGVTSRFFRRGSRFYVNTMGPDAALHDYEVTHTFGVAPLQQYLVPFPGGRLQPLPLAWDTRPRASGGARWFTLDHVAPLGPHDDGHWSGRALNWNYMCADCHATAVRKRYAAEADTFATTYVEVGVGCEACHGPGREHADWGRWPAWLRATLRRDDRLASPLRERTGVRWTTDSATGQPARSVPRRTDHEIDTCAPCHARRVHIADGWTAGKPLLDYYDPDVLVPGLYHADGQQHDEVYDHASFLQSRMYAAGVTCADCHDPHTQQLRAPGRATCLQCHVAARYDDSTHHGHRRDGPGSDCAACHLPVETYLEIDGRHDHSIRVPRPDRTQSLGVPNACASCHADRPASWATQAVARWRRSGRGDQQPFAEAFAADARGEAGALARLLDVARDSSQSAVARASAFARLARYRDPAITDAARVGVSDGNALVRRWAVEAMTQASADERLAVLGPALSDPLRAVRQRAAWHLAAESHRLPSPALRAAFERASADFETSQRYNADRADHRVALGIFLLARGDTTAAIEEFRVASRRWPRHAQAVLNLAGVMSLQGRERDAEAALRAAIRAVPDEGALHHALAQSLARQGRLAEAVTAAERALELAGAQAEYRRTLDALRRAR